MKASVRWVQGLAACLAAGVVSCTVPEAPRATPAPSPSCFGRPEAVEYLTVIRNRVRKQWDVPYGVDPNETRFKRVGCFDVGVRCGGWGHIVMELKVEDRRKQAG